MINKINGIDVSEYFIEVVDEGGSTIDYKILPNIERLLVERIFEQNQQLARLQEKNEELKKLKCKFKEYCTCDIEKYRSALEEIREQYIHSIFYKCDKTEEECPCHNCIILGQLDRVQNIVKIIDEVLNDRD